MEQRAQGGGGSAGDPVTAQLSTADLQLRYEGRSHGFVRSSSFQMQISVLNVCVVI